MTTQLLDSEIVYRPATRDYDILICGQIVASAANFFEAEAKRTRLLAERRDEGHYATATELDEPPGVPGEDTDPSAPPDLDPAPGRHLLFAVATTARQWLDEDWRRDAEARAWSAGLLNT